MKKRLLIAAATLILCVAVVVSAVLLTQPPAASNGILYRVNGPNGTAFLLGSLHIGTDVMYPFGDHITRAMEDSDTFVFESDSSDESTQMLQARMLLPTGTLRDILGDTRMDRVLNAYQTLGIRSDSINQQQPWVVISTLAIYSTANEMGINNVQKGLSLGVDNTVKAYADKHHKQLRYLETVNDFPDMMESFSPELLHYLIDDELNWILQENQATRPGDMKDWPLYWQSGDVESFWNSYTQSTAATDPQVIGEYNDKLLIQRNLRMAEQLDEMLTDGGNYFVTVGLLHLIAPGSSIPALLEQQGYTVVRIEQ